MRWDSEHLPPPHWVLEGTRSLTVCPGKAGNYIPGAENGSRHPLWGFIQASPFIIPSPTAPTNIPRISEKVRTPRSFYSREAEAERKLRGRGRAWKGLSSWSSFCPHSGGIGLLSSWARATEDHRQLRKSPSTALGTSGGEGESRSWQAWAVSRRDKASVPAASPSATEPLERASWGLHNCL